MRIVHVGDSESGGGAAHAMSRLHGSLRKLGVDSRLLVRHSAAPGSGAETLVTRGDADELFPALRDALARQYVELNRTGLTNTHFSLYVDGADLSRLPLVESSALVHLHWTAPFQTPADVRALLDAKPVVWTLHDLAPLTGGCHFAAGCEGYADGCSACPQLARDPFRVTAATLSDKKTFWAGSRPTFVAPSRYVAELAQRSAVAQAAAASVVHIPHGIDVETFRPQPKAAARRALGIPEDGLYVLCGSNHNLEQRKGLTYINRVLAAAAAESARGASDLKLLTVGEPKLVPDDDLHGAGVFHLGRVPIELMPTVYAAADVFLFPSAEDNFPGMLLESASCGTPAVAFDVGGVREIVQDQVSGRLVAPGDERALGAALAALLGDAGRLRQLGERARAHAEASFDDVAIARRYAELYQELVEVGSARRGPLPRPPESKLAAIFPRWSAACLIQELEHVREQASRLAEESRAKSEHIAGLMDESRAKSEHIAGLMDESRAKSEHIAGLMDESRAKSEHIAGLERDAAVLARSLADQRRQVQEKEAEVAAIHQVANERKALADELHVSATRMQALAAELERMLRERDDAIKRLQATIDQQSAEIELVHRAAADRQSLIEDLHAVAEERAAVIDQLASVAEEHAAPT